MSSGFRIETLDRSGRWYLSPGTRSIYDLRVRNQTRDTVDCVFAVEDPPSGVVVDPAACVLRGSEVRTITVIVEPDAPVARSQRVVVVLQTAAGEQLARFEHPVVITGGSDCSLTLALDGVVWDEHEPRGVVVSCTVRSQSEGPTSFALGVTPHPSLQVAPIEPLWLEPGETGRVLIPIRWEPSVKDEQGRNHPPTIEIGVAVSNGRRTGRIRWDLVEEKLRSAVLEAHPPRREDAAAPIAVGAGSSGPQTDPAAARSASEPAARSDARAAASAEASPAQSAAAARADAPDTAATRTPDMPGGAVGGFGDAAPLEAACAHAAARTAQTPANGSSSFASSPAPAQAKATQAAATPSGSPTAQPAACEHGALQSGPEHSDAGPARLAQRFDLACLPSPQALGASPAAAADSRGAAVGASDGALGPQHASATMRASDDAPTRATGRSDLEAALTAQPSDFAKSVRVRRTGADFAPADSPRTSTGIVIGALAVVTIAAAALMFRSAPSPAPTPPAMTSTSGVTTTVSQPTASAGPAVAQARRAMHPSVPNSMPAARVLALGHPAASAPTPTPHPTTTPGVQAAPSPRTPAPAPRRVAAGVVRPRRAAYRPHLVLRPALEEPPPGPVVALGGIEAYYGPGGHVVRVFWSAAQQVSAAIQLLSDSGKVISATRVRGHRQQALLYLPRWFHGGLTVMVSSVGRMGERVAQTTSLPPFGY